MTDQNWMDMTPICEAEMPDGLVEVIRISPGIVDIYNVKVGGVTKHFNLNAEGVMRILTHYLRGVSYRYTKLVESTHPKS